MLPEYVCDQAVILVVVGSLEIDARINAFSVIVVWVLLLQRVELLKLGFHLTVGS